MQTFHRDRKRWRRRNIRYGSWLRDNALTQPATVRDPVNVVRHGRSEQFFPVGRSGAASESSWECWRNTQHEQMSSAVPPRTDIDLARRFGLNALPIHCYGKARQWLLDHFAEADRSAGLPKTLRQPSVRLARCLRMQAVIRCTFGISDAQSRKTSPVQSCR
jgi:hypothetical protein